MSQFQVLKDDQTTSDIFRFQTPRTGETVNQQIITIPDTGGTYPGGTWELEMMTADGSWTEQGESWGDFGSRAFYAISGEAYRLTGGTVGVVAYASDAG